MAYYSLEGPEREVDLGRVCGVIEDVAYAPGNGQISGRPLYAPVNGFVKSVPGSVDDLIGIRWIHRYCPDREIFRSSDDIDGFPGLTRILTPKETICGSCVVNARAARICDNGRKGFGLATRIWIGDILVSPLGYALTLIFHKRQAAIARDAGPLIMQHQEYEIAIGAIEEDLSNWTARRRDIFPRIASVSRFDNHPARGTCVEHLGIERMYG